MDDPLTSFLLAFTSLFTMINPIGVIPVYLGLTASMDERASRGVAIRGVLISAFALLIFAFTGKFIFDFFAITTDSLKIVGGVLFFLIGYDMLQARAIRTRDPGESERNYADDVAITPLAIPIICGPGAITIVILLMQDAASMMAKGLIVGAILSVMLTTFVVLVAGKQIRRVLGVSGNKILMRLMGLIVMVIAVEFFFSGLGPKMRTILLG